jgi:hypothetical protein
MDPSLPLGISDKTDDPMARSPDDPIVACAILIR